MNRMDSPTDRVMGTNKKHQIKRKVEALLQENENATKYCKRAETDFYPTNDGASDSERDTVDNVRRRIIPCLEYICHNYEGFNNDEIKVLGKYAPQSGYTKVTTLSQNIANTTKRSFFIEPHKTFFSRDARVAWKKALSGVIHWWRMDDESEVHSKLEAIGPLNETLNSGGGESIGLYRHSWANSSKPTELGTYIDKVFGHVIMRQAASLYGLEDCAHLGPGRRQSPAMPWIAATPDGVTCLNEKAHEEFVELVFREGKAPPLGRDAHTDKLIQFGAPLLHHEFKSIQKEPSGTSPGSRISAREVRDLYNIYTSGDVQATREACVELMCSKLEIGNWMPRKRKSDGAMSTGLADNPRGSKVPSFFKRGTLLYPAADLDEYVTERVSGRMYPHLLGPDEVVPFKEFRDGPGRATVTVYEVANGTPNKQLFQLFYDKAPLVLSPKSSFYCQMTVQAMSTLEYNELQRYLFSCVFSGEREKKSEGTKLAMLYSYDTGIDRWVRDRMVSRTLRCLGDASTWLDTFFTRENVYERNGDHLYYAPSRVEQDSNLVKEHIGRDAETPKNYLFELSGPQISIANIEESESDDDEGDTQFTDVDEF